jgi:hypothetical protein
VRLLDADPRPWLLDSDEPFARWVTLRWVLDRDPGDPETEAARRASVQHPAVQGLLAALPDWEHPLHSHNSASSGVNLLQVLADLGLAEGDDARIDRLLDQMLSHRSNDGRLQSYATFIRLPEPAWASMSCDHAIITEALVRFGRQHDPRVRHALDLLANDLAVTSTGMGWRCRPHPVTGGRGPGRVADPCPQVTLEALRAFGRLPVRDRPIGIAEAAQTALAVWRQRAIARPYMFGHGRHFTTVKWPNLWYSLLWLLQALEPYPEVWSGPAAATEDRQAVASLVATLAQANVGPDGTVTPRSCYRGFEGFSFGRKRGPSPVATAWVCAVLRAYEPVAEEALGIGLGEPVGAAR